MNFVQGNLLDSKAEALVNTVNTVGVMGKGIALMFKEAFPENYRAYQAAAKKGEIETGRMFVTERNGLDGPRWLINFPTKKHWRQPSQIAWIEEGLKDLRRVIEYKEIKSLALPPLGCGNGGLDWDEVRPLLEAALSDLPNVEITVFEPTAKYQNVAKRNGVKELTPARALVAEIVRRYWVLGMECTYLEVQKLCWFLERVIKRRGLPNVLDLRFTADRYGPYSDRLRHLLDGLDGSYLHCDKRLADAGPLDLIWFEEKSKPQLETLLQQEESQPLRQVLDETAKIIDGFESPLGMELLATVDWLIERENALPSVEGIHVALKKWPTGAKTAARKSNLFDDRAIVLALERVRPQAASPEN